jgi:biotin synthase-related radical SAM superfamily protein
MLKVLLRHIAHPRELQQFMYMLERSTIRLTSECLICKTLSKLCLCAVGHLFLRAF